MNTTGITQRIIANSKRAAMLLLAMMLTATMAWAQDGTGTIGDDTGGNTPIGEGDTPGGDFATSTPLTLEAKSTGSITVMRPKSGMKYSIDRGPKTLITSYITIYVTAGQRVQFYGHGTAIQSYDGTCFKCSVPCYIYGNIMSLVDEYGFATNVTLTKDFTFDGLFVGNSNLQNHPTHQLMLPATTLNSFCYANMFDGCIGLTRAPELPATALAHSCYFNMFYGCKNLNYVKCLATDISAPNCTTDWLNGVAESGTFVKAEGMDGWERGKSCIPNGWTVKEQRPPLTLEAIEAGIITVLAPKSGMKYSINDGTKTSMTTETTIIHVSAGQKVRFYGNGTKIKSYSGTEIQCSDPCYIYGNIMSLVDETGYATNVTLTEEETFKDLFSENSNLRNHQTHRLELPATTLTNSCYSSMFYGCSGLTTAPELPATTLTNSCYSGMFYVCSGLTTAPELPAKTLADLCYFCMFFGCTGLTTAPELPATTLTEHCYAWMFYNCTGLTAAPELPATTLTDKCYEMMFIGCTNLNYVKCLATDISAYSCTKDWLYDVAESGTFVKADDMNGWGKGSSGIPSGWNVKTESEEYSVTIVATASPAEGGTVTGGGRFAKDATVTLTATPAEGYVFVNWTEGTDTEVSTDSTYTFSAECNRTLTANFRRIYDLAGNYVMFFDEDDNILYKAVEGQTVTVSPEYYLFDEGRYFTHTYSTENEDVTVTVNEVGDGTFIMPGHDVTVSAVLGDQSECTIDLTEATSQVIDETLREMLRTLEGYLIFGDNIQIDVNRDGTADVAISEATDETTELTTYTVAKLPAANSLTDNYRFALRYEPLWPYNSVLFKFNDSGTTHDQPAIVTMSDGNENHGQIEEMADGKPHNVILEGRTLYKDGGWNTLCLPFDVSDKDDTDGKTFTGTPLEGATVKTLTDASFSGGTLTLNFSDDLNAIAAGTPYIIRWAITGNDLTEPLFENVIISTENHDITCDEGKVQFKGIYDPISFDAENKSILFMGAANTLYYPAAGVRIGTFRSYFEIDLSGGAGVKQFNMTFGEDDATRLTEFTEKTEDTELSSSWFSLDGKRLSDKPTQKGIYIYGGRKIAIK